jgi:SAM-dependent methyltransferase
MPSDENPTVENAYDKLSLTYKTQKDDPYCADFEFPAMTEFIPNVEGKRILDAGCGHGRYAEWLVDKGADVLAVDKSSAMIDQARHRVSDQVEVRRANIGKPFEFVDDGEFDGIVSGLTLHYIEDWRPAFIEFARILRPGGFFVFSTHHPLDDYIVFDPENYFETEQELMTWSASGEEIEVPFYRRPFSEVINPLIESGFHLDEMIEPKEMFKEKKPESYEKRLNYPTFLCIRALNTE